MQKYDIILCDPPWDYGGRAMFQTANKTKTYLNDVTEHYSTMTVDDMIQEIDVMQYAADDCLLFMWATWPHLDQAIKLGTAWGFRYVHTPFVWNKFRLNTGYYTMTQTEPVLCFKKGKIPRPRGARNVRQLVESPYTKHSEKPHEVNARIDLMFPEQKKLEMFARRQYPGWDVWGNEV
jgi:N6-adenosine-specific RNA methylase IME4